MNKATGWCDITMMGQYNHKKGGHLILFDIDKITEFSPGSHILIPSAVMQHTNTAIQPHEKHMGFTQYAAGELFRWVDSGLCKLEEVRPEVKARMAVEAPARFKNLLNLYSKLEELEGDHTMVHGNQ
jgi:hypothetical protein